jgi:hypothetical protein
VAVANIAFSKAVTCRFTLDYWKTTSEVAADYSHEIRPRETPLGHDRFTFSIKLADTANLESKTLFLCVRYAVNGLDYWDNNDSSNFQIDFRKKHLPQNGKNNFQGASSRPANGLPRSNRRNGASTVPRPKSMPAGFGEFGEDAKLSYDQPIHEYLGESGNGTSGLRLKSKSAGNLASDNMAKGFGSPSGLAFSNRYDFGASLSAAVQAAKDSGSKDKDGLYMKANVRSAKPTLPVSTTQPSTQVQSQAAHGATSPNSTLSSSSYEELVNKYCFFGSKQSSPNMRDGTLSGARFDGSAGGAAAAPAPRRSNVTALGSPNGSTHHAGPAAHHSLPLGHGVYHPSSAPSTPKDAFMTFDGTPSTDVSYHVQQQMMMDRFPWTGDSHAATAIRG